MDIFWNPWHGCRKLSPGCANCYVYRRDSLYDIDSRLVRKTKIFSLPAEKNKNNEWKIPAGGTVYTCFTSDFLLEEADEWRKECWDMIFARQDLDFFFITKRIDRFDKVKPDNWGSGYCNVSVGCTVENMEAADYRLPIFLSLPIKRKHIIIEPMLEEMDISKYLSKDVEMVTAGGESGNNARICNYDWILKLRKQCVEKDVPFYFKQTGAKFVKDGRLYLIKRKFQHSQAKKANINYKAGKI